MAAKQSWSDPEGSEWEGLQAEKDRPLEGIETIERDIREAEANIACIDKQLGGDSCVSFRKRTLGPATEAIDQLQKVPELLKGMATYVKTLVVAVAVKTIVFPILFLVGADWTSRLAFGFVATITRRNGRACDGHGGRFDPPMARLNCGQCA